MRWLKKLDNPVLLVLQGMALGAILFAATHPDALNAKPKAPVSIEALR